MVKWDFQPLIHDDPRKLPEFSGGDVESWEDLEEDSPQNASKNDVPSDALCISGVPPGIQEMVMQCLGDSVLGILG